MSIDLTVDINNMEHSCGECSLCCIYPAIEKIQFAAEGMPLTGRKPYGKTCAHCTSKGCSVYEVRPPVCRNYECLWKFGLVEMPPLVSKAIWALEFNHETSKPVVVCQCESSIDLLSSPAHLSEITKFLSSRINGVPVECVVVRCACFVSRLSIDFNGLRADTCDVVNEKIHPLVKTSYYPYP